MAERTPKTLICLRKSPVTQNGELPHANRAPSSSESPRSETAYPSAEAGSFLVKYLGCGEGEHVFELVYPPTGIPPAGQVAVEYVQDKCPRCSAESPCPCCGQPFGADRVWCRCDQFVVFLSPETWRDVNEDGTPAFRFRDEVEALVADVKKTARLRRSLDEDPEFDESP